MSSATPPPVCTTTWSATITESAIVISAWRSSWPWFQRRSSCCIASPSRPATSAATSSTTNQLSRLTCAEETVDVGVARDDPALHVDRDVRRDEVERAVRHVDDAHQPEDEREAARDDEVERAQRDRVEQRREERRRVAVRGPVREEEDPDAARTRAPRASRPNRDGVDRRVRPASAAQTLQHSSPRRANAFRRAEQPAGRRAGGARHTPAVPAARILRLDAVDPFALADGVHARALFGDATMLNLVELEPGAVVPEHSHPHEQMGIVPERRDRDDHRGRGARRAMPWMRCTSPRASCTAPTRGRRERSCSTSSCRSARTSAPLAGAAQ